MPNHWANPLDVICNLLELRNYSFPFNFFDDIHYSILFLYYDVSIILFRFPEPMNNEYLNEILSSVLYVSTYLYQITIFLYFKSSLSRLPWKTLENLRTPRKWISSDKYKDARFLTVHET